MEKAVLGNPATSLDQFAVHNRDLTGRAAKINPSFTRSGTSRRKTRGAKQLRGHLRPAHLIRFLPPDCFSLQPSSFLSFT